MDIAATKNSYKHPTMRPCNKWEANNIFGSVSDFFLDHDLRMNCVVILKFEGTRETEPVIKRDVGPITFTSYLVRLDNGFEIESLNSEC